MRPRAVPWLTLGLCAVMVAWHGLAVLGDALGWASWGGGSAGLDPRLRLVRSGARSSALVADLGQGWRIFSAHLVHTGWLHLLFNLAFLFPAAGAVESITPRRDFVALLLTVATGAGVASLVWTPEISAGASGLVYGTLTAAVLVGLRHRRRLDPALRPYVGLSVLPFLLIVLALGLRNPAIDHASHLGGLVGGAIAGPWMGLRLPTTGRPVDRGAGKIGLALALTAAGAATLAAPTLATHGLGPAPYRVSSRVIFDAPPGYVPRLDPLGQVVFTGRTRLVRLTVDAAPRKTPDPAAWVESRRLAPLLRAGILVPEGHPAPSTGAACSTRAYRRDGYPVTIALCLVTVGSDTVAVTFETPREWARAYVETRDRVLGSMRPGPAPTRAPPGRVRAG